MKGLSVQRDQIDDTETMPTFKSDNDVPMEEEGTASVISKNGINLTRTEISTVTDINESQS